MKRHNPSLAILLACLSTAAALNGCQWDSSEYDAFYNPSLKYAYLCPNYCDTTGVEDLENKCRGLNHEFVHGQCVGLTEAECIQLKYPEKPNITKCKEFPDNYMNIDECPYAQRTGIMLNNSIYMYMAEDSSNKNFAMDRIFCGTYDEITNKDLSPLPCHQYFKDNQGKKELEGLTYERSYELFVMSMEAGICPYNTFTCTKFSVVSAENGGMGNYGFCSECKNSNEVACFIDNAYACTDIKNDKHNCGGCNINCKDDEMCSNGFCESPKCEFGYHYHNAKSESDKSGCVRDTIEACGSDTNNCNEEAGWQNGECHTLVCTTKDTGGLDCNWCTEDTLNKCLSGKDASTTTLTPQCHVSTCKKPYERNPNTGKCECTADNTYSSKDGCTESTINKCGSDTNDCTKLAGWKKGKCENNICVASDCNSGYELDPQTKSCKNLSCKGNTHDKDGVCVEDTVTACGNDANDCTKNAGWKDGNCDNKECIASECDTGYDLVENQCVARIKCNTNQHLDNGECVDDTINACGSTNNDCTRQAGWVSGICENADCVATSCATGYDLSAGQCKALISCGSNKHLDNGTCVEDSINACGSSNNDCTKMAGWISGECKNGNCVATTCDTGYDLSNGQCKALISCGANKHLDNGKCVDDSINACGSTNNNCTKMAGWKSGECKQGACVARECNKGYDISSGQCVALVSCTTGKHLDNGSCIDDSINACGSTNNNCTKMAGWKAGECKQGACNATTCDTGYDLSNGQCVALISCGSGKHLDSGSCVDDSINACGSTNNNCTKMAGWQSGNCVNGGCVANACITGYSVSSGQCVALISCPSNQHLDSGSCVDDSINACGSTNNDCTKMAGWQSGNCVDGGCVANSCKTGYSVSSGQCVALISCPSNQHLDSGSCVDDSINACGSTNNDCTKMAGWQSGECIDGGCVANACKTGYDVSSGQCVALVSCPSNQHLDNGTCVADSINACGSTNNDCTKLVGWQSGDCSGGVCIATACKSNYHVDDESDECVADSAEACGSTPTINCYTEISNVSLAFCNSGSCYIADCSPGYTPSSSHNSCECDSTKCNTSIIPDSVSASCDANICKAIACENNYHISTDYTSCIENSTEACGASTSNTPTNCNDSIDLSIASMKCENSQCKVDNCNSDYHITDNNMTSCTANSDTACAETNSYITTNCTNTINRKCSGGTCCRQNDSNDPNPVITEKPNCCSGKCLQKTLANGTKNYMCYRNNYKSGWQLCD